MDFGLIPNGNGGKSIKIPPQIHADHTSLDNCVIRHLRVCRNTLACNSVMSDIQTACQFEETVAHVQYNELLDNRN